MADFVIHDTTPTDTLFRPVVDGEAKGLGAVPRDYAIYPQSMFQPPSEMPLIPRSEWSARIKEKVARKSQLSDIRNRMMFGSRAPSLDQNGQGFCWAYSTTMVVMLLRGVMNQPYIRLSGHAVGCKVKGFKDEGGWCGLSAKFHREVGCPSVDVWPEKSMSRANDRPETWANGALHKVTEDWIDLTKQEWDQTLKFEQVASCLLSGVPCAVDFNWWGHSVCALDLVEVEANSFGLRIINSWTDGWGEAGTGVLQGSRAIPDGAVALRVTGASEN